MYVGFVCPFMPAIQSQRTCLPGPSQSWKGLFNFLAPLTCRMPFAAQFLLVEFYLVAEWLATCCENLFLLCFLGLDDWLERMGQSFTVSFFVCLIWLFGLSFIDWHLVATDQFSLIARAGSGVQADFKVLAPVWHPASQSH